MAADTSKCLQCCVYHMYKCMYYHSTSPSKYLGKEMTACAFLFFLFHQYILHRLSSYIILYFSAPLLPPPRSPHQLLFICLQDFSVPSNYVLLHLHPSHRRSARSVED